MGPLNFEKLFTPKIFVIKNNVAVGARASNGIASGGQKSTVGYGYGLFHTTRIESDRVERKFSSTTVVIGNDDLRVARGTNAATLNRAGPRRWRCSIAKRTACPFNSFFVLQAEQNDFRRVSSTAARKIQLLESTFV